MKSVLGAVVILGALAALVLHVNPWACVALAVLGGVLVDPEQVTGALKVVAPYIPGRIGQRLSGGTLPPRDPPGGSDVHGA